MESQWLSSNKHIIQIFANQPQTACYDMDVHKQNTVSLTYESLQVLPWNNDTTIEKKDSCNRCRQITDLIQYIHSWNQGQKREFLFPEFGWVKFFYHLPPALSKLYQNIYFLFQKEKRKNTDTHTNKKEKKLKNTSWL